VDTKKSELTQLQYQVDQTISLLNDIQLQSQHLPHIRFYKGKEGIQTVIHEMLIDDKPIAMMSDSRHFDDLIDNKFIEQSATAGHYNKEIPQIKTSSCEHTTILILTTVDWRSEYTMR